MGRYGGHVRGSLRKRLRCPKSAAKAGLFRELSYFTAARERSMISDYSKSNKRGDRHVPLLVHFSFSTRRTTMILLMAHSFAQNVLRFKRPVVLFHTWSVTRELL